MNKVFLAIISISITLQTYADPYEHCVQILNKGAFDKQISYGSSSHKKILKNYLCSQESRNSSNSSKFDFSADVIDMFSGDAGYSDNSFKNWKLNYCHKVDVMETASATSYQYLQIADPSIVDAWKSCVADKNKGLACWASPVSNNKITFHIRAGSGQNDNIKTKKIILDNAVSKIDVADKIQESTEEVLILEHTDIYEPAIIIYKGEGDQSNVSCQYVIPAKEKTIELKKFYFSKSPGLAFAYNFEFSQKILIDEGIILIDGNTHKITTNNTTPSRFLSGAIVLPQYPTQYTQAEYQSLYWSCQAERGCKSGDLSCVNGCREGRAREYSRLQGNKNTTNKNKYNNANLIRANLIDTNGNSYFSEVILK